MQQLPKLLGQQFWELLRPCWQWCANGCNNAQEYWDPQCIVGEIPPIWLWRQLVCNALAWPQQCWKNYANGSNIVVPRFGDHGTKEMLGVIGSKVWQVSTCAIRPFARGFNEEIGIIIHLISINSTLQKAGYVALDAPTSTLRSISGKTCWTGSTRISTNISWRRKVSAINTCITRLTIHLAGINVAITESSCVSSLTCAAHIHEFAVSVDFVTFFWGHALTTVVAGAHVNRGTPGCTRSFIVSGNEWKIKLKQWKKVIIFSSTN